MAPRLWRDEKGLTFPGGSFWLQDRTGAKEERKEVMLCFLGQDGVTPEGSRKGCEPSGSSNNKLGWSSPPSHVPKGLASWPLGLLASLHFGLPTFARDPEAGY